MSIIYPLFSSSSGNSTYIGTKNCNILIDAGASFKGIKESLERIDATPESIGAVMITHEHIDHIKGLKTFLNKTGATLIASEKTLSTLINDDKIPKGATVLPIDKESVEIGGIKINRFATSHDCAGSSGYTFLMPDNKKVSVCTDLGIVTEEVHNSLLGSDLVLLESNHDVEMLKKGPYPPELKVRILSDKGHISNTVCATELKSLLQNGTNRFILGHLSQHNNTPMLAKRCAISALIDLGAEIDRDYTLYVAKPSGNGVTVI